MFIIIVPIKNEAERIVETVRRLIDFCVLNLTEPKIFLIDDHSTDSTLLTLSQVKSLWPDNVHVFKNLIDSGKGSAIKFGFVLATMIYRPDAQSIFVFLDGDGQVNPVEINTMKNIMALYDADVVVGNKRHDYSVTGYSLCRKIVSAGYNLLVRILFGINFRDTQCGIKIFKKHALERVIGKVTSKKYAFDVELLVAIRESKLRIADAPVTIQGQTNAGSVSVLSIIETFYETMKIFFKFKNKFYRTEEIHHGQDNFRSSSR